MCKATYHMTLLEVCVFRKSQPFDTRCTFNMTVLTLSMPLYSEYFASSFIIQSIKWKDDCWMMNCKGLGRLQSWPAWGTIPAFAWKDYGKPQKNSVWKADFPAKFYLHFRKDKASILLARVLCYAVVTIGESGSIYCQIIHISAWIIWEVWFCRKYWTKLHRKFPDASNFIHNRHVYINKPCLINRKWTKQEPG
jgi:hypothetical protein